MRYLHTNQSHNYMQALYTSVSCLHSHDPTIDVSALPRAVSPPLFCELTDNILQHCLGLHPQEDVNIADKA